MTRNNEPSMDEIKRVELRPPVVEASFLWRRLLAYLLDASLLLPIVGLAVARVWMLLDGVTARELRAARHDVITILVATWIAMLAVLTYNRWWRQGRTGQSWGKRIMGLRLVSVLGDRPIGPGAAFLRDVFNSFVAVGPALALVHPRGQTLGDMAVGAVVREVHETAKHRSHAH